MFEYIKKTYVKILSVILLSILVGYSLGHLSVNNSIDSNIPVETMNCFDYENTTVCYATEEMTEANLSKFNNKENKSESSHQTLNSKHVL